MAPLTVVKPGHAVLNFRTVDDIIEYFDTYPPHFKTTPSVVQAMKVMLYPIAQAVPDEHLLVDIKFLDSGKQVEKLINALVANGWNECKDWSATYDWSLAEYVFRFQLANLPRNTWAYWFCVFYYRGQLVDFETRQCLNKVLNKQIK
jgi:hypothetical protein